MSAAEVIEQIKKLSPEDRRVVAEHFRQGDEVALRDATMATPTVNYIPQDVFEASVKRVFAENRELLARLAK